MNETNDGGRFAWLRDKRHRRAGLAQVESALSKGQIDAEGRVILASELAAIAEAGGLSSREAARVSRIVNAMNRTSDTVPDRSVLVRPEADQRRHRGVS